MNRRHPRQLCKMICVGRSVWSTYFLSYNGISRLKKRTQKQQVNLLDLKPTRNLEWEVGEKNCIVLLIPKFQSRFLVKHVMPNLKRPYFHIKLDEYGSLIWNMCDGNTTIGQISDSLNKNYGAEFDPSYERISNFFSQLIRDKFVVI